MNKLIELRANRRLLSRCHFLLYMSMTLMLGACANPVGLASITLVPEQPVLAYVSWVESASPQALDQELTAIGERNIEHLHDIKRALLLSENCYSGNRGRGG
jgi:hypothetical protein